MNYGTSLGGDMLCKVMTDPQKEWYAIIIYWAEAHDIYAGMSATFVCE